VCCGLNHGTLHDLLYHLEDHHSAVDSDSDMMEIDDIFELDSETDVAMTFQQSLYDDVRTMDYYASGLRSNQIQDLPQTVPYRFDQPTVISDYSNTDSQTCSSSTDDDSIKKKKTGERPFKCTFEGCAKSYKNPGMYAISIFMR